MRPQLGVTRQTREIPIRVCSGRFHPDRCAIEVPQCDQAVFRRPGWLFRHYAANAPSGISLIWGCGAGVLWLGWERQGQGRRDRKQGHVRVFAAPKRAKRSISAI